MMKQAKRLALLATALLCSVALAACGTSAPTSAPDGSDAGGASVQQAQAATAGTVKLKVGKKTFKLKLANTKAAKAFKKYLKKPRSLKMHELNGNEKYHYFAVKTFPAAAKCPNTIHAGDVMLYGNDCLVVFYKTFSTSYSYTKIGHLKSTKGLAKALGSGSVKVKFAK